MNLIATQTIWIPEGEFHKGEVFRTSPEIGERLLAKGHAVKPGSEAVIHNDPVVESRDPQPVKLRKRK